MTYIYITILAFMDGLVISTSRNQAVHDRVMVKIGTLAVVVINMCLIYYLIYPMK